ncbi:PP2C family protein-serine/threonine phosphatase [Celeribacter sp.]|uniref:PP2C family protein-serine/threonine phosphatase n=1 Tax=Celeribacter sp. TaxID=1890673 RepID=UPI003A93F9B5
MALVQSKNTLLQAVPERGVVNRVLVVDDSMAQRKILASHLKRWGYEVVEAGSGEAAIEICRNEEIDLVISDWVMPEVTGLDFLRIFRELEREHYGYFILVTSKSDKAEIAQGLDVGADDFLSKPVSSDELLARIRAGERILKMERELTEKNRLVSKTFQEISDLYDSLDKDLIEARRLQQSLIRERHRDFGNAQVSLMLKPSGHVGGDLVGFYPITETCFGLFSLDVSGHGVASALMTARLAAYFSGSTPEQNIAIERADDGSPKAIRPAKVAATLNKLMLEEMETDLYFTMTLGHFDFSTGELVITQAGHPHPLLQSEDGSVTFFGDGGLPVGLIPNATFEDVTITLKPKQRVILYSDGVTECMDDSGEMLDEHGLKGIVENLRDQSGNAFFDTFLWDVSAFGNDRDFDDDVSALMLEFDPK